MPTLPPSANLFPCGIIVLNANSLIESVNSYGCELLGHEAGMLTGKRIDTLMTVASRIYFQTHMYPLITLRGAANELYLNLLTKKREKIPVLLNAIQHEQAGESFTYLTFIPLFQRRQYEKELLDAKRRAEDELLRNEKLLQMQTELERHQAELDRQVNYLRQRNDELEQFGKIISHDLQEPLRKLLVFVDLLTTENDSLPDVLRSTALTNINKAATRLRTLILDLQFYFTQTNQIATTQSVDLTALVRDICQEYESAAVQFDISPLPTVSGNQGELNALFRHLIDNAVKFRKSDQGDVVRISGEVVGHNSFRVTPDKYNYIDYARIFVSDNGVGFDGRQHEEVFRIMKKLHPRTPGIGLGLAIAKKIAERHNGQIAAESVVGEGTKITVLLPLM